RAGEPLQDFAISFDHAPGTGHDDKFEAVSSVYRLRQSRCFLESGGKLEGATCHDPHRIPRGEEAARHYSQACRTCHAAAHSGTGQAASATHPLATQADAATHPPGDASYADCVACHMPKRRVDDAPHVIMTDHRIQRRPPANALVEFAERPAEEYHGEVV